MYEFRFRGDMPEKFLSEDFIRELPHVYVFLQQYEGRQFATEESFLAEMGGFHKFFSDKKIEISDSGINDGICFMGIDGRVGVIVKSKSGFYCFGKLEKVVV